jgi:hypothetical protein
MLDTPVLGEVAVDVKQHGAVRRQARAPVRRQLRTQRIVSQTGMSDV